MHRLRLLITTSTLLISPLGLASNITLNSNIGNGLNFNGQGLIPLYLSEQSLLYTDLTGRYSNDNTWSSGLGLGYRRLVEDHYLGGYVFADYNRAMGQHEFWSVNPGLEYLGSRWDWRLNGYLPLGQREWQARRDFADKFGDYQFTHVTGHQQYNHIYTELIEIAPGADLSTTWHNEQRTGQNFTFGGYYFDFHHNSTMNGLYGSFEQPINRYFSLVVSDSYDNLQRNLFTVGIKFSFNTQPKQATWLMPIERNLANRQQGAALPQASRLVDQGGSYLERDNILFFHPDAHSNFIDSSSCTAEHPCSSFDQAAVDHIHATMPNANIYLSDGHYQTQALNLYSGQALYGRSDDYRRPGANTFIIGHLNLNSDTALNDIQLLNDPAQHYSSAITINNANNVSLNHVIVGSRNTDSGYLTGIETENSRNITIENSHILAFDKATGHELAEAIGIYSRSSQLTIKQSTIEAIAQSEASNARATAITSLGTQPGLVSELTIEHSHLTANANSLQGVANSHALDNAALSEKTIVNISDSLLNANADSKQGISSAIAINNHSEEGQQSAFTINHSLLQATSNSLTNQASAQGISNTSELEAKDNFIINASTINAQANGESGITEATAIFSNPSFNAIGRFNITDSYLTAQAASQSGNATALVIKSAPYYDGISQFIITGSTLEADAASKDGVAQATAIQAENSELDIEHNLIMSHAAAKTDKAKAQGIADLGGNKLIEKDNKFIVVP